MDDTWMNDGTDYTYFVNKSTCHEVELALPEREGPEEPLPVYGYTTKSKSTRQSEANHHPIARTSTSHATD